MRHVDAEAAGEDLGKRIGIVVVARPARAEQVDVAAFDVLKERLELDGSEADIDAEGLLPHRSHGKSQLVVNVSRVVVQLETQRFGWRVSRLRIELARFGETLCHGRIAIVE